MKTVKNVVDAIYALLPVTVTPLYKYSTPDDYTAAKFYVINALTIPKDPIQTVEFNVNCYAKDLNEKLGIPDMATLDTMCGLVITALHDENNDVLDIEFAFMNLIRDERLKSHFLNLRFKLVFINN